MSKIDVKRLGALKDKEDVRDYKIKDYFRRVAFVALPSTIDYTNNFSRIIDQGNISSCVGCACAAIKESEEYQEDKLKLDFSPLFIYWQRSDGIFGMCPRDAMDILLNKGCCLEWSLPYKQSETGSISQQQLTEAENYKIKSYARIETVEELKQSLVEHGPAFIAISVYDSFRYTKKDGLIPYPNTDTETWRGGHALCVVGYNDSKQLFKVKNSWGKDWGANGYGYLSYDYVKNLVWDIWNTVDAESKKLSFWNLFVIKLKFTWNYIVKYFELRIPFLATIIAFCILATLLRIIK